VLDGHEFITPLARLLEGGIKREFKLFAQHDLPRLAGLSLAEPSGFLHRAQ
jgi:hypothetical protein